MKQESNISDIGLAAEGIRKIEWVAPRMVVMNQLRDRLKKDSAFRGSTVAVSVHLEAKTAYLCLVLKELGATVWATGSNPFSTKDEVAATLAEKGVHVFARHGASSEEHRKEMLSVLSARPEVILDDGAEMCMELLDHPELGSRLKGLTEETTTGVHRLRKLHAEKKLRYAAVTVNEAKSKHLFDNRYGTGQSTWTAITHLTNMTVSGRTVVVVGYGWVGRGVATIARGLGAHVVVTEVDPWKALEAHMDGFSVLAAAEASRVGQLFITATGLERVLREEHFQLMPDGALVGNAGHSDSEVDVPALRRMAKSVREARENVTEYTMRDGRQIYLLAEGRIVNIAGGLGHPVEIMDMSFSLQLLCLEYLLRSEKLEPGVYEVPVEIDELVVRAKLEAEGIGIDGGEGARRSKAEGNVARNRRRK